MTGSQDLDVLLGKPVKSYSYIGNPEFIPKGEFPPRTLVESSGVIHSWMSEHRDEVDIEGNIPDFRC